MGSLFRRLSACGIAAMLVLAVCEPASASPETLRRSMGNILFAPIDIALSPVIAAHSIYRNLRDVDDSVGVKIAYPLPGFAWNTGLQIGTGAIRGVAGLLELLPGLVLLPFEADMAPLFSPAEKANAMVDIDTPPLHVRFGLDYSSVPY